MSAYGSIVRLLDADPDLGETLPAPARQRAAEMLQVRVATIAPGPWEPPNMGSAAIGLLLLDGLIVRRVHIGPSSSTELLGPTDMLRPGESELVAPVFPDSSEWRVLQQTRLAVLDARVTAAIGAWPEVTAAICARLLRRSRSLAYLMAAQNFTRVTDRLLAALWLMAGSWGRVSAQGTIVPFRLTHEMLGAIVGARRPATTQAVTALEQRGLLLRDAQRRFVLIGDPPTWTTDPADAGVTLAASG
jgi:CRP-like cAMP-binding protein